MIKSEQEYRRLKEQVEQQEKWIAEETAKLKEEGHTEEMIRVAVGMADNLCYKWKREVQEYEDVINGKFDAYTCSLQDIGTHLIKLRIWRGMSQTALAKKLGVSHAQVSRDERFEYQGANMERIRQILKALEVNLIFSSAESIGYTQAKLEHASGQGEMAVTKEKQVG
jgi:ribosome-binding protein aMBF1 (putative translation factor)